MKQRKVVTFLKKIKVEDMYTICKRIIVPKEEYPEGFSKKELKEIFGYSYSDEIFLNLTCSEIIERYVRYKEKLVGK